VIPLVASPAHEFSPVISPDGKWVAYLSHARDPTDVWLKSVSGGDPVNLTANLGDRAVQAEAAIGGIDMSPDGTELAFVAGAPGEPTVRNSIYVIPVPLGGTPRRLLEARQGMRWSPDGKRIAFIKPGGSYGDSLYIAGADGQHEREVVKHEGARHVHWPRWSRDGRYVGCYHVRLVRLEDPGREFASIRIAVNDDNFDPAEASGHDRLHGITRRAMSVVVRVVGMQEAAGVEP